MSAPKTLNILDVYQYGTEKVADYGVQRAYDEFQHVLDAYNTTSAGMYSDLVQGETSERRWKFGGGPDTQDYVDLEFQWGEPDADSVNFSEYEVGLPLAKAGTASAWTDRYLQLETVERFNVRLNAALLSDAKWLRKRIGAALFGNANYTYKDKYVDNLPMYVKRLLNADGQYIPMAPDGTTFDGSTHNHYVAITAINNTNMLAIENNLLEHVESGTVVHYINKAQEAAVRGLTGFIGAKDPRIVRSVMQDLIAPEFQGQYELNTNLQDRLVGIVENGGEYHIKPWIPSGFIFSFLKDSVLDAPLMRRRDPIESSDMRIIIPTNTHPRVGARKVERIVGFGVAERRNGVATKITNGSYAPPAEFTL